MYSQVADRKKCGPKRVMPLTLRIDLKTPWKVSLLLGELDAGSCSFFSIHRRPLQQIYIHTYSLERRPISPITARIQKKMQTWCDRRGVRSAKGIGLYTKTSFHWLCEWIYMFASSSHESGSATAQHQDVLQTSGPLGYIRSSDAFAFKLVKGRMEDNLEKG